MDRLSLTKLIVAFIMITLVGSLLLSPSCPVRRVMLEGGIVASIAFLTMCTSVWYALGEVLGLVTRSRQHQDYGHNTWLVMALTQIMFVLALVKAGVPGPIPLLLFTCAIAACLIALAQGHLQLAHARDRKPK
jgi:hypothetical protein